MVKAGDPLATLVPGLARGGLWLGGNDVPLVAKGQSVRLQFEGLAGEVVQFVGWPSVAIGTFPAKWW